MASALTRVPYSLLDGATPIKWVGNEDYKTQVLGQADKDLDNGFFFLQKNDDGTSQIFAMTFSDTNVPSFVEISGGSGSLSDITSIDQLPTVLQDALNDKLDSDFSSLTPSTVTDLSKTDIVAGKDSSGKAVSISLEQIKKFVNAGSANEKWRGWHPNLQVLQNWITSQNLTLEDGCWAILADTDTIWVYDGDTSTWKDTGKETAIPDVAFSGQNGIEVTGSIVDGAITVKATDALVQTTDSRLLPAANIIGMGTEQDRKALTGTAVNADQVGKYFIETYGTSPNKYGKVYRLDKGGVNPEWMYMGEPQQSKGALNFEGLTIPAKSRDVVLTGYYTLEDYIFLVFVSGILQHSETLTVAPNQALNKTTISLAGDLASTLDCNVVLLPR